MEYCQIMGDITILLRELMYVTEQFVQGGRDKLLDCVIMKNHTGLLIGKWKHFISLYLS